LFVRDSGKGPPLLLLHGLLATGDEFGLLSPLLSETYRLVVPDLRGHGRGGHLPGPYDAETIAADLGPTLDALGVGAVHVLGHSHGGAAAQAFTRAHPDRVRSLMLVSTYTVQQLTWWERMAGILAPPGVTLLGTPRLARLVHWLRPAGGGRQLATEAAALRATMVEANDSRRMAAALRSARRFDSRGWLGAIEVPTLVMAGDTDRVVAPRQARLLAAGIPGALLHVLAGAGHELPLSHPIELAQLVGAWLDDVETLSSEMGPSR
jgi:pimeloyl-ACP methyl ester carboxylesterase